MNKSVSSTFSLDLVITTIWLAITSVVVFVLNLDKELLANNSAGGQKQWIRFELLVSYWNSFTALNVYLAYITHDYNYALIKLQLNLLCCWELSLRINKHMFSVKIASAHSIFQFDFYVLNECNESTVKFTHL